MTILYPWMLLLLPLILLPWRNRKSTVSFPSLGIVQSSKTWRIRFIWVPPLLASFGLIFLIFASSRPIEEKVKQIHVQEGLDIVLVVDTSGSMQENDYSWNGQRISRMGVARETIKEFVSQRPYDRIGLVVFGEEACTQAPLTMNQKGLLPFVEQIKIGVVGESSTAIGDGIAIAAQRLKSLEAPSKLMIVLTDGRSNTGADPILMAKASAELGITIYTIGIGGGRVGLMGMMGLTSSIDGDSLSEIARITGGKSFVAQTGETLKKVYKEIDTLEPSPAEFEEYTQRKEYFSYFAWCGLILLLLEWSLSQTLFRRLP
mgnify:CR=1 FL=1